MSLMDKVKEYTYIGIGSASHTPLEKYDDRVNQIFPLFVRELGGSWTIIHVDPYFEKPEHQAFLDSYLKSMGFLKRGPYKYETNNIDILFYPKFMEEEQRESFLTNVTTKVVNAGTKLIVQQYTGHDLIPLFKKVSKTFSPEDFEVIKKNVIWDITYGDEHPCSPDMRTWKPLFIADSFFNLTCMTDTEVLACMGKNPRIDEIIATHFNKEYNHLINVHHVNFRRRMMGLECLSRTHEYNDSATPEQIMEVFSAYLLPVVRVLKELTKLSDEKYSEQLDCINNYKNYDVYKWYSLMRGIYK
jgi:hypothetical protein